MSTVRLVCYKLKQFIYYLGLFLIGAVIASIAYPLWLLLCCPIVCAVACHDKAKKRNCNAFQSLVFGYLGWLAGLAANVVFVPFALLATCCWLLGMIALAIYLCCEYIKICFKRMRANDRERAKE